MRDVAGNQLAAPFSFSFVTGDSPGSIADLSASVTPLLIARRLLEFGQFDLFKVREDGTGAINVTNHPSGDADGAWSPDGRHIAFSSDRSGNRDVYIMRDDGTALRQLTTTIADDSQPRWSADGQRLLFLSDRNGASLGPFFSGIGRDVFSMNADGSAQTNLTRTPAVDEYWPSWSPDGKKLLYGTLQGGSPASRLMVADADGTNPLPLRPVDPKYSDDVASWSPDGSTIAFSALYEVDVFVELHAMFLIAADGSNQRLLTAGSRRFPSWSPNGSALLYAGSGYEEFWGRFGEIDVRTRNLATGAETLISPKIPTATVGSPQAWRK